KRALQDRLLVMSRDEHDEAHRCFAFVRRSLRGQCGGCQQEELVRIDNGKRRAIEADTAPCHAPNGSPFGRSGLLRLRHATYSRRVGNARLKVLSVVGTRPNMMKIAPIASVLRREPERFEHVLVHTGQHYDHELSTIFLEEFALGDPQYMLG